MSLIKCLPDRFIRWLVPPAALITCLFMASPALANDTLAPAFEAIEARDYQSAIESLATLSVSAPDRDVLFHLARAQYYAAEYQDAADTLANLHKRYPGDADASYLSGLVYLALVGEVNIFRKPGMAKKTLEAWQSAIAADPGHLDARYAIFAYYASAPGIAGGDLEVARQQMLEIAERDQGYGAMARGLLLSKENDDAGAEAAFQEAARLMNRAGPYFSLARFYLQTEQYENAISSVEVFRVREKRWWDPDITVAQLVIAKAYAAIGNRDAARREATHGLSLNPNKQVKALLKETLKNL